MRLRTTLILLFICLPTYAENVSGNLTGEYQCISKNTDATLNCKMRLTANNETYSNYAVCNDGSSYRGTGIYDQEKHILALAAANTKSSTDIGVAILHIKKLGQIDFKWANLNSDKVNLMECKS